MCTCDLLQLHRLSPPNQGPRHSMFYFLFHIPVPICFSTHRSMASNSTIQVESALRKFQVSQVAQVGNSSLPDDSWCWQIPAHPASASVLILGSRESSVSWNRISRFSSIFWISFLHDFSGLFFFYCILFIVDVT